MIKRFKRDVDLQHLYKVSLEEGVFVIPEYLNGEELQKFKKEVIQEIKLNAGNYEFGRNLRGKSLSDYSKNSMIYKIFSASWMYELYLKITQGIDKGYGVSIYANHDYLLSKDLARNGWLHFDRNSCWKYFIYLNDINIDCGAFSIVPKSHLIGKNLHKKAWEDSSEYNHVRNRIEIDYPELMDDLDIIPIEEKEGALIAFNTDCFHKGGQVLKEGCERLVIRLNNFK